jgi:hypothetical protein
LQDQFESHVQRLGAAGSLQSMGATRIAYRRGTMVRPVCSCALLLQLTLGGRGLAQDATLESVGQLWACDSLTKVLQPAMPCTDVDAPLRLYGSRGEIVSGQAVFRPADEVAHATVNIDDLKHRDLEDSITAGHIKLQWVRYIEVNRNSAGVPDDELVAKAPTRIPDPYWEADRIAVQANMAQPVWIEVKIPRHSVPGDYLGKLVVTVGEKTASLPVILRVWDFDMPAERHLSVINWGVFPGQMYRERPEDNSAEYYRLFGQYCAFLVEHRQTDVIGSLNWINRKNDEQERVAYDTRQLERHAEVAFAAGVRKIHLHAVGRKTAPILDPIGRVDVATDDKGSDRLARLEALEQVIQRRGWQDQFLVSITDEPFIHHEESFAAAVKLVHQTAPSVRVIEAVETEYLGELDVYVPKLSHLNLWYPRFDEIRRVEGRELWFYTCCHPTGRYPNRFLDQSLLKVRVLHWINYLYDLDGYLHWGLNHYGSDDPYSEEGISKDLPLGDRAIVYPGEKGLVGSLRFSAQRDGLQDYETLWVLEDRLRGIKQRTGADAFWLDPRQRPLELCRRVVWSFHDYTRDPNVLLETRRLIAEEIETLQTAPLLVVQTSPPEGTPIPAGPRMVNVRGLASPGAEVRLNGEPIQNLRPSGYFSHYCFLTDDPVITVAANHQGTRRVATRTFELVD